MTVVLSRLLVGIVCSVSLAPFAGRATELVPLGPVPPLKGLVLWADSDAVATTHKDAVSLEFAYVMPREVAREVADDGTVGYDWTPYERLMATAAGRGHQMILRVRYVYPGETVDGVKGGTGVPAFIKRRSDYHETFAKNPNGDGPTFYADWSNAALKDFTLRFVRDLAARYDRDARLAYVELGFGHWAEYHTCGTKTALGVNFPDKAFQEAFVTNALSSFRETPVLFSIDAQDRRYSPLAEKPDLRSLGFGLFDDSFMHARHDVDQGDGYNEKCWRRFGADHWQKGPCGGEISYYSERDQREFLNPAGLYGITWERAAAKYHMTFVIANDSVKGRFATPDRFCAAAAACGWNFRIKNIVKGQDDVEVEIENNGVAPAYHDIRLEGGGVVSEKTLKGLLPGASCRVRLPSDQNLRLVSRKFLPNKR